MLFNDLSGTEVQLQHILHQIRMLVVKIHQSRELSEILKIVVHQIRKMLESDRVIIYRFLPDGDGVVAEESVTPECTPIVGKLIYDPGFNAKWVKQYQEGRIHVIEDINTQHIDPCDQKLLRKLQVRANLVVPILINNQDIEQTSCASPQVWGLLITQQCSGPRQWNSLEIEFLQLIAIELGIAVQQAQPHQPLPQFHQIDQETLRAIEALRHTSLMISLYTIDGVPLMQNPAALSCYSHTLHPNSSGENVFLRHFVDAQIGQQAIDAIHLGDNFRVETEVWTNEGMRSHEMDIRCTRDPVTGNSMIVVNERDITQQQIFLEERQPAEDQLHWQEALLPSMTDTPLLEFFVVDNRTDEICDLNHCFCENPGKIFSRTDDGVPLRLLGTHTDMTERKRIEEALRQSEERYRSVISTMAEGIVLQQANGSISACNDSAERILGLTADQMMGRTSIDPRWRAIHEDGTSFPGETHPAIVTLRTGEPQFNVIMGVHKPDGSLCWISINSKPLFQADELTPYAVVTSFTDITARKQAELLLQQQIKQERMVAAIAQHIRQSLDLDQILNTTVAEVREVLQTDRVIIYRFKPDWTGVIVTESVGKDWKAILNMEIIDSYFAENRGQLYQDGTIKVTSDIYTAGLSDCHLELLEKYQVKAKLVVPLLQGDRLWGLLVAHHCSAPRAWESWESELLQKLATQVAIAIQQSELYQKLQLANQQLKNMALVDQLTQIANRRRFDHKLHDVWQNLLREKGFISLLLCDIDYFKQYNDTYGHTSGDDCLLFVAQALKQTLKRSTDLVARYGGEEFVVILTNTNTDGAVQVAEEIHTAIQQLNIPHATSAVKQHVTLSIGIATLIPTPDLVPLELISAADQALYQAKAQGRNCSFVKSIDVNQLNYLKQPKNDA